MVLTASRYTVNPARLYLVFPQNTLCRKSSHTHTHSHTPHVYSLVYTHAHTCTHMHTSHTHTNRHTHTHAHMCLPHTCIPHMCVNTYVYMCAHTCVYVHFFHPANWRRGQTDLQGLLDCPKRGQKPSNVTPSDHGLLVLQNAAKVRVFVLKVGNRRPAPGGSLASSPRSPTAPR